ncbi:MAG: glycosyltransferase [Chitinivibrionales bacterium]|nr:glycosyltransferase [Chitinivibrionales bacterium]
MKTYNFSDYIKKYGAANYLKNLRQRCLNGVYSTCEFRYYAAKTYLAIGLHRRALALLGGLDPQYAPSDDHPEVLSLCEQAGEMNTGSESTCSLNMIVRNESELIEKALDSADDIMDEIVICDTGSTDSTPELAQLYGVTLISHTWAGSFSEARNVAIDASTCDWIFWIDADDQIDAACKNKLRNLWRRGKKQTASFCIINEQPGGHGPEFMQFRLFPRMDDVRFKRRIHEQIVFSAQKKNIQAVAHKEIRIHHSGYNQPRLHKEKAQRNKTLIMAEIEDNPNDISLQLSLGECHTILGEIDDAIIIFTRIAENKEVYATHRDTYVHAHFDLGWLYKTKKNFHQAKRYLARCLYLDQTVIEAHYMLGLIFFAEKSFQKAFNFFVRTLAHQPKQRYVAAVDIRGIKMNAFYYVGDILLRWKKYKESEELLARAMKFYPDVVEYYTQMGEALMGMNRLKEAALFLSHSVKVCPQKNPKAYGGIAALYIRLNDPHRAADFLLKALENDSSSPEIFALIGDIHFNLRNPEIALNAYEVALSSLDEYDSEIDQLLWKATSSALDSSDVKKAKSFLKRMLQEKTANPQAEYVLKRIELEDAA